MELLCLQMEGGATKEGCGGDKEERREGRRGLVRKTRHRGGGSALFTSLQPCLFQAYKESQPQGTQEKENQHLPINTRKDVISK